MMKRWIARAGLVLVALALLIPAALIHFHTAGVPIFGSRYPSILMLLAWAIMLEGAVLVVGIVLFLIIEWCWDNK